MAGSMAHFYSESEQILRAIVRDIDKARKSVLMEFYIWNEGGAANEVSRPWFARPAGRVVPRAVDAVGARPWWRGRQPRAAPRSRACRCNPPCPSVCCKAVVSRNDLRCTARSSWSTATWPGRGA